MTDIDWVAKFREEAKDKDYYDQIVHFLMTMETEEELEKAQLAYLLNPAVDRGDLYIAQDAIRRTKGWR